MDSAADAKRFVNLTVEVKQTVNTARDVRWSMNMPMDVKKSVNAAEDIKEVINEAAEVILKKKPNALFSLCMKCNFTSWQFFRIIIFGMAF